MRDDVYIHSRPGGVAKTSAFIEYLGLGVAKTSTLSNIWGSAAKTLIFIKKLMFKTIVLLQFCAPT